jgi:hypothetical protein
MTAVGPSSTPRMAVARAGVGSRHGEASLTFWWQRRRIAAGSGVGGRLSAALQADACGTPVSPPPPHTMSLGAQIHGACDILVSHRRRICAMVVRVVVSPAALGVTFPGADGSSTTN